MTSFDNPIHKQKALECAHNILELKFHFKSRLILIQWLDEKDWINSMYTTYIMCNFLSAISLHVCGS
jgi:hypothetical protein